MSFMQPQIVYGRWYQHVDENGDEYWADEDCSALGAQLIGGAEGWGARLSASGYMDTTEWLVCDTEDEAREELAGLHDLCPLCLAEECRCHGADRALREVVDG